MFIRNGCLFIHIPKTGGTSIRSAMMHAGTHYVAIIADPEEHIRKEPNLCNPHAPWDTLLSDFGEQALSHLWTFTVVRNPWDRYVSWWKFSGMRDDPFEKFLEKVLSECKENNPNTQSEQLRRGRFDYIARIETLKDDWKIICNRLAIYKPLEKLNKTKHDHYSTYYTDEQKERVRELERFMIDIHGYSFDERYNR